MDKAFSIHDQIGDIAARFPEACELFSKYGIDFCCGGNCSLKAAADKKRLDADKIADLINERYQSFAAKRTDYRDWTKEPSSLLIDYIVNTHHAYLREKLPQLSAYISKIMKVHGKSHEELFRVYKLFNQLRQEMEQHLEKEEAFVFPLIKLYEKEQDRGQKNRILERITELEKEHAGGGDIIKLLREVTENYDIPKDTCVTFQRTYQMMEELEAKLFEHLHLENNILFKHFR